MCCRGMCSATSLTPGCERISEPRTAARRRAGGPSRPRCSRPRAQARARSKSSHIQRRGAGFFSRYISEICLWKAVSQTYVSWFRGDGLSSVWPFRRGIARRSGLAVMKVWWWL